MYRIAPLQALSARGKKKKGEAKAILEQLITQLTDAAEKAGLFGTDLHKAIITSAEESAGIFDDLMTPSTSITTRKPQGSRQVADKTVSERAVHAAIAARQSQIEQELLQIPASIEKARTALEFDLRNDPGSEEPPDALCMFGADARRLFPESVNARRQALLSGQLVGAIPQHGWDIFWYVQYLRYVETFEPKDGRPILLSECQDLEDGFRDIAKRFSTQVIAFAEHAVYELPNFLAHAWSYGRCRTLRHTIFPLCRRSVALVLQFQRPDGAWPSFDYQAHKLLSEPLTYPDTEVTAQAIVFLAGFGRAEEVESAIQRASTWLIKAQHADGFWYTRLTKQDKWPILTTLQVLDALRRASIPFDHPALVKAENALMAKQAVTGYWHEENGLWPSFLTSLAIEYFQKKTERGRLQNSYLRSARSLLLSAEQMVLSHDDGDASLATAAAYHGVEHFLYGCILELDAEESIYADSKGQTIGLHEALGAMQRSLQKKGILSDLSSLPYRQNLKQVASKRDMFIHRAEPIPLGEAITYIATCRSFVERFDVLVLGARLCE